MPSPGELEPMLLGGPRRYTRAQAAEAAGVTLEHAQRLWLALGFAEVGDEPTVFTDGDVEALRAVRQLIDGGILEPGMDRGVARQLGQTFSRLAVWQVELLGRAAGTGAGDAGDMPDRVGELIPLMDRLQSYVWRRHLAAAAGRLLADSGELDRTVRVVGFADVVGYTRMSRAIDEVELAAFVERFESTAADIVATHGARIVKTVGDEVLFVVASPTAGAEVGLELASASERDPEFPALRVGLALGAVLSRYGDVYGSVVNIAARLTSLARPGTVLVDEELATALRGPAYRLRATRPTSVRGFHHLKPRRLTRAEPAARDAPAAERS